MERMRATKLSDPNQMENDSIVVEDVDGMRPLSFHLAVSDIHD